MTWKEVFNSKKVDALLVAVMLFFVSLGGVSGFLVGRNIERATQMSKQNELARTAWTKGHNDAIHCANEAHNTGLLKGEYIEIKLFAACANAQISPW